MYVHRNGSGSRKRIPPFPPAYKTPQTRQLSGSGSTTSCTTSSKVTYPIDPQPIPAVSQSETLGVRGYVCGRLSRTGGGYIAPLPPCPPQALPRVRQGVQPLQQAGHQKTQESHIAKKMDAGDCSWSTCQTLIRWIVESTNMTINLPPH